MAAKSYKIRGIEPPDLGQYDASTRKLFWSWVVEFGIKAKGKEILAGKDKDGNPLKPIAEATRKHRKSEMTPTGKGDPSRPPLIPGWQKSRTYSLLAGRALTTHAEFFWRYDVWTGESWGEVLAYQAAKGRDVIGISVAAQARVKVQSWARWAAWKHGTYRAPAITAAKGAISVPRYGQRSVQHAELGVTSSGSSAAGVTFLPGHSTGWSTPQERAAWRRETASARVRSRPGHAREISSIAGPRYNRIIAQTWGGNGRGGAGGPAMVSIPPAPPRLPIGPRFTIPPPTPATKPKPKPAHKPEPKPRGHRLSDFLDLGRASPKRPVQRAIDAIEAVHGTGAVSLARIPVKADSSTTRYGAFSRTKHGPVDITISRSGNHKEHTMVHECGHFLERFALPGHNNGARDWTKSPELDAWVQAVRDSAAIKALKALKGQTTLAVSTPVGTLNAHVDQSFIQYLLSPHETWARAYAQYITLRSKDQVLRQQLDSQRDAGADPVYHHIQWTDADFEPIAKVMDKLFAVIGWRS